MAPQEPRPGGAESATIVPGSFADVREHAGLLLERGPGEYGFIHLTFEEYLAAMAIAFDAQGEGEAIAGRLRECLGEPAWREVALLLVGYVGLIQQLPRVAGRALERLVADRDAAPGAAVVLAGEALLDAGAAGVTAAGRERVTSALVETMQSAAVAPRLRREAGLELGRLGWQARGSRRLRRGAGRTLPLR